MRQVVLYLTDFEVSEHADASKVAVVVLLQRGQSLAYQYHGLIKLSQFNKDGAAKDLSFQLSACQSVLDAVLNQLLDAVVRLLVLLLGYHGLHLHQPHLPYLHIRPRHLQVKVQLLFDFEGLIEAPSIHVELVASQESGVVALASQDIVPVLSQELKQVQGEGDGGGLQGECVLEEGVQEGLLLKGGEAEELQGRDQVEAREERGTKGVPG